MAVYDIVILGAGASGLMAASSIKNKTICVLDNNSKIASKIKVSGGAKCNITNKYMNSSYYLGEKSFIDEVFKNFNEKDLLKFLNKNGVYPKIDEKIVKGTYFCNSSSDVIDMFKKITSHCDFRLNTEVLDASFDTDKKEFIIKTNNSIIKSKKLIVATGGISYSSLGATDIGFKIAKKFGHTLTKPNPALVGFTVQKDQFWFKDLSGLSLDVKIKVLNKTISGKMLFTHKGCSGPAILSTSLYWEKGSICIDFLPNKNSYLPKRFRQAIKDKNIDIRNYIISPAGNFGYSKAEVTKGGIKVDELTKHCESRFQNELYFIGEVVDVTGELGGYNFQWAFSSAKNIKL
ncbi:MAG: aminoacetone oxidase family FAD-binding enzyme [Campylobacterota bacterium]|nr:aminoacetone oxidase family FAD-binding enzyme [Campylobacterota bacterium]